MGWLGVAGGWLVGEQTSSRQAGRQVMILQHGKETDISAEENNTWTSY